MRGARQPERRGSRRRRERDAVTGQQRVGELGEGRCRPGAVDQLLAAGAVDLVAGEVEVPISGDHHRESGGVGSTLIVGVVVGPSSSITTPALAHAPLGRAGPWQRPASGPPLPCRGRGPKPTMAMSRDAVATAPPARVQRAGEGGVALARRANSGPVDDARPLRASESARSPRTAYDRWLSSGGVDGPVAPGRASTTSARTRSTMPTTSMSLTRVCPAGSTRVGTTSVSTSISRENSSDVEGWIPVRRRCRIATYHGGSDHSWEPQQYDAHQMIGEDLSQDEIFPQDSASCGATVKWCPSQDAPDDEPRALAARSRHLQFGSPSRLVGQE